jgi:hypothetical protein
MLLHQQIQPKPESDDQAYNKHNIFLKINRPTDLCKFGMAILDLLARGGKQKFYSSELQKS